MEFIFQPWQLYFLLLAGWINREQQELIEYLRTENQALREKLGKKRLLLNDDQRRRLALKGKILGRKRLKEFGTLFTPDTILQWHRMDRDTNFSAAFRTILAEAGVNPVRLPPKSPNLNAQLERFHLSIKSECLSRMIFFSERALRNAVGQYLDHYHKERNHQGLNNQIITAGDEVGCTTGDVKCNERLGGLLKYYHRQAA